MKTKERLCTKIALSIFFLLVLCRTAGAQDAKKRILSAADAGTCTADSTACSFLTVPSGSGGVTFTITANASANTVQFEATGDTEPAGSHTWVALSVFPSNATTSVTSTTSTGTWQANVAGFTQVRLRMSTFVGGTTTTYINLSTASARSGGGGGLPTGCTSPGTGAITCTNNVLAANLPPALPTTPNGVSFIDCSTPAGGIGVPPQWCWPGVPGRSNAGATDAIAATDRGAGILETNGGAVAVSLPQAGTTNFGNNFDFFIKCATTTVCTITPTTSQIAGNNGTLGATLVMPASSTAYCYSFDNANYQCGVVSTATNAVSSVFTRTGAVVAAANDYTLDQIGNPVAGVSFQPTVDAGFLFKQSNTTNTADIFHVQTKGGAEAFRVDSGATIRIGVSECTIAVSGGAFDCSPSGAPIQTGGITNVVGGVYRLLIGATAPTISSGFGTSPSVTVQNGSASFRINVGTGGVASTGVIGLPAAANGWNCQATDITTQTATVDETRQTGAGTTTTVPIGNFTSGGIAAAWVASDILAVSCLGL